ncbi:MAG TPA: AAA family ATPase [Verrucomicrobiae bacterium]|nr:AAA family ATPase [Verrucomicrobiae bacterium]
MAFDTQLPDRAQRRENEAARGIFGNFFRVTYGQPSETHMPKTIVNGPPTPEEFQRQLQEMMRQHFSQAPGNAHARPQTERDDPAEEQELSAADFEFAHKPREVKRHLDRFVIRQDEAKKVLSVALCDHYHSVRLALAGKDQPNYTKQNIILLGPTGVGKTYLIRSMAELIRVPFVKADATKFSETGYVGGDVEDLVRDLVRKANGDIRRAQYGIIYIDEIDKIAAAPNVAGRDVSGRGVQTNLLKLMEETEVPARAPNDIAGQIQAMMETTQRGGKKQPATINTKHILFVVSGAFGGLEKIVRRRAREATIGFAAGGQTDLAEEQSLEQAQTRDFVDFGFEPEFIGRLPVRVVCRQLGVDDLFLILKNSEGSIVRQFEQSFAAYGIEVLFRDDGLRRIAELAAEEKTGARGLMTVCERIFRELKFELPSTEVKRFVVTRELVESPAAELQKLLAEHEREARAVMAQVAHEFAARFRESHGIKITFTETAARQLVSLALEQGKPVRDLCAERFKDYQFGLKLISQNTGQQEFAIDERAVAEPDKVLSEWVVASYVSVTPCAS